MRNSSKPDDIATISSTRSSRPRRALVPIALAAGAAVLGGLLDDPTARAVEFGNGGLQGSVDTTISQGLTFRVEERDETLAGKTNSNDGNLNYDRGIVANTSKFTTDLDMRAAGFGVFVRTIGFIDHVNRDGEGERTELDDEARDRVGSNISLLDAYVTAPFEVGDAAIDLRLGRHVLNWGESTFIPNGIAVINPFDVSKLRLPGSELREALLPVWMASTEIAATEELSVAGFYQFSWEETHIDPVGSYFSVTDYAGPGARKAVISQFTGGRDDGHPFGPLAMAIDGDLAALGLANPAALALGATAPISSDPDFASADRGPDGAPRDSGQWGVALRYLAEDLNHTEFGFYFINYHSRLPTITARTAGVNSINAGLMAAGAVGSPGSNTVTALGQQIPDPATVQQQVQNIAAAIAVDRYAKGVPYSLEYPEDIQLFGLSFNSVLGASGWALQGEYSLRPNAPLQRAERTVLAEGLGPIFEALQRSAVSPQALGQFLATYQPTQVQGFVERKVSQVQATGTRVFGPMAGADALVLVGEAALMHVHDMPDEPLESPAGGRRSERNVADADADATSWGYRLAVRLDYNNAIGATHLYPYAQFLHDVSGNSPAPSGPFIEGRTALTVGVRADYLSRWQADVAYTYYGGDGNGLSDRDFVSLSVKYSF